MSVGIACLYNIIGVYFEFELLEGQPHSWCTLYSYSRDGESVNTGPEYWNDL